MSDAQQKGTMPVVGSLGEYQFRLREAGEGLSSKNETLDDIHKRLTGQTGPYFPGQHSITPKVMQTFATGATRSDDSNKPDFEGFLSPLVIADYGMYMQEHRTQDDGTVRASDNWQRGMPFHKYLKSLWRHLLQLWLLHRGHTADTHPFLQEKRAGKVVPVTVRTALAGILFNTQGYYHEYLMDRNAWENRVVSEPENADVVRAPDVRRVA